MSQVTSVGRDLSISSNLILPNLDGLSQLTAVGRDISIWGNSNLLNVDGMAQITNVVGELHIYGNTSLKNLDGFSQVTAVGGWFNFQFNESLLNINGLNQITTFGGNVTVRFNKSLFNLDGISNVTTVIGHVRVQSHDSLNNINGLNNIISIGSDLRIEDNPRLSECCALCPILAADAIDPTVIGGSVTIEDNLIGCRDVAVINASTPCGLASIPSPIEISSQLNIYPNPAENFFNFEYQSITHEVLEYSIENQLGQQIAKGNITSNELTQIDVSKYPNGLYFIRIGQNDKFGIRQFQVSK